jgi:heme exporter protein A
MAAPLLEASRLSCIRDQRMLFDALDVQLADAEILQIEGVNGAGKTSLLRILCGLLPPRQGTVSWRGEPIEHCRPLFHGELLYIGHHPGIKEELSAQENLLFYRSLGGFVMDGDIAAALDQVGLYGYEDVPVRSLSAGQRRRVALARLWLSTATLWILDEPLTAIDSDGIRNLEARLRQHRDNGGSVVLTSHQTLGLAAVRRLRLS